MSFFMATIGELIIIQACVLIIWLDVLMDAIHHRDTTVGARKLLLTSIGLVLNAIGMTGVLVFRLSEYVSGGWPFIWGITSFYIMLAIGGILFIITPALGGSLRAFKCFLALTIAWTSYCIAASQGIVTWPL